jgi:hypothetical protein
VTIGGPALIRVIASRTIRCCSARLITPYPIASCARGRLSAAADEVGRLGDAGFDGDKGLPVGVRPWDHQVKQAISRGARADPEVAAALAEGAALAIVPLLIDLGRPTKANLSLDAGLLAAIDEAAAARGLTRSAFLAGAARKKIESGG